MAPINTSVQPTTSGHLRSRVIRVYQPTKGATTALTPKKASRRMSVLKVSTSTGKRFPGEEHEESEKDDAFDE